MLTNVRGRTTLAIALLAAFAGACSDAGSVTSGDATSQTLTLATASAPEAPSLMSATAASATQINLKWQDNSSTETGFQIESRTGSSTVWNAVATVGANTTTYQHNGLLPATQYSYHVRSCLESKCSERPAEASATTAGVVTPATAPSVSTRDASSITAHAVTVGGTVTANRQATTAWVEYATASTLSGAISTAPKAAGDGTSAISFEQRIEGLSEGATYYYRAVAQNSIGRTNGPILSFRTSGTASP